MAPFPEKVVKHLATLLGMTFVAACVGCGPDRATVTGRVTRADGTALAGAKVVFRMPSTGQSARGVTDADGRYELGTLEKGDGIPPGEYKVAIAEDRGSWDAPSARTVHARYEKSNSTDLTAVVEAGDVKKLDFVLDPP